MRKKTKIEFYANIQGGRPDIDDRINGMVAEFYAQHEGEQVRYICETVKDVKSYEQLKFYWGVIIVELCKATGIGSRSEMDAICRNEFLKEIRDGGINGPYVYIPSLQISANEVDRVKMSGYINDCLNLLADAGGQIDKDEIARYYQSQEE